MGAKSKNCHPREPVFFISPQVRVAPQESALRYDGLVPERSFISEDPIGWASGQTNNYAYVAGNPVQFADPFGLKSIGQCALDHYGLNGLLGDGNGADDSGMSVGDGIGLGVRGVVAIGALPVPKPFILPGASSGTNVGRVVSKLLVGNTRIPGRLLGTASLAGVIGRANLLLGVGLLAYDLTSIGLCAADVDL